MVSFKFLMKTVFLSLPLLAVQSAGHIIGGAVNTMIQTSSPSSTNFQTLGVPSYLKFIVAARRPSVRLNSVNHQLPESNAFSSSSSHTIRDNNNPFLRRLRREAAETCSFPEDIDQRFRDLNSALDVNQFVMTSLPPGQPNTCPKDSPTPWWPHETSLNLRSTCPWIYENKTTEENLYPREITQARCLCDDCMEATGSTCHPMQVEVKLLRKTGCQNGQAILEQEDWLANVGCFCAKGASQPGSDGDDYPV